MNEKTNLATLRITEENLNDDAVKTATLLVRCFDKICKLVKNLWSSVYCVGWLKKEYNLLNLCCYKPMQAPQLEFFEVFDTPNHKNSFEFS